MSTNDVVQNEFLNRYIAENAKFIEFMTRINTSLESLNDNNVLHRTALEENSKANAQAVKVFEATVGQMNKDMRFWKIITFLLVVSIIILAGVEKANELIPHIPIP